MANRGDSSTSAFADPALVDAAVADALGSRPGRTWKAAALVRDLNHPMLEVMMALARLTSSGQIERTSPGRYRLPAMQSVNHENSAR